MWKKQVCQICGWVILGGGACTVGYFAWKHDIFKTSGNDVLSGSNDLNKLPKEELSEINLSDVPDPVIQVPSVNDDNQTSIENEKNVLTPKDSVVAAIIDDVASQISTPQKNISVSNKEVNNQATQKTTVFYEFIASESCSGDYCLSEGSDTYELEILGDDGDTETSIVLENIFKSSSKLNKQTFIDNQKYLIEIKKLNQKTLLDNIDKTMKITFNSEAITTIVKESLKSSPNENS